MKYILPLILFLSTSCSTSRILKPRESSAPKEPLPQPSNIVEPFNDPTLAEQSHIQPFFYILFLVLSICLIPYLYTKMIPHLINLGEFLKNKYRKFREKE